MNRLFPKCIIYKSAANPALVTAYDGAVSAGGLGLAALLRGSPPYRHRDELGATELRYRPTSAGSSPRESPAISAGVASFGTERSLESGDLTARLAQTCHSQWRFTAEQGCRSADCEVRGHGRVTGHVTLAVIGGTAPSAESCHRFAPDQGDPRLRRRLLEHLWPSERSLL